MDYETKIYLDNLIEAVKELSSPDWWTIGITAVNAAIMIWLGWNQYKLQKRQTKLQEQQTKAEVYEQYKELYICINSIHSALSVVVPIVINSVFGILNNSDNINRLQCLTNEILALKSDIDKKRIELNLKVGDDFEYDNYINALDSAENLCKIIIEYLRCNLIKTPSDYLYYMNTEKENVECILNSIDKEAKSKMGKIFDKFYRYKAEISSSKTLIFLERICKF